LEEKERAEKEQKKLLVEKFKRDREAVLASQKLRRENDLLRIEEEKKRQMMAAKPLIEQREAILKNKEIEKKNKQVSGD
jgi:hypothetical protein